MIVEVKLIHNPEIRVVGMTENVQLGPGEKPSENAIANLWDRFNKRSEEIPHQVGFRAYGLIHQIPGNKPGAPFPYTAAVGVTEFGDLPEGMVRIELPAALYAVVTYRGLLDGIGEGFGHFWKTWRPKSDYIGDGEYVFEFYDQRYRNRQDPHSEIDLYFTIAAKPK
ncbi:MAG: putative transcriptional regulator [Paenibacillaceae bacterium]|jgi:AraC family transcriptional regulator|nr:putative transcriptional regulator [Paenibacillaceae bacterium]